MEFSDDFLNILYFLKLEKLLRRRNEIKAELKDEIEFLEGEELLRRRNEIEAELKDEIEFLDGEKLLRRRNEIKAELKDEIEFLEGEELLRRRNEIQGELKDEIEFLDDEEHIITELEYEDDNFISKNGLTKLKIGSTISKNESTNKNSQNRKIKRQLVFKKSDLMPKQNFIKTYDPNDFKPFIRNRKNEMCDLCGIILRRSNLEFHMNSHYNRKPFVCDFENCNLGFSAPSTLFRHRKLHTANKQFACDICSAKFHFNGNLQKHKVIHSEPKFKCLECGNMFKSSTRLRYHITIMHGEFQNIDCTVSSCDKKFANSLVLRKHLRIYHGVKVKFRVQRPEM